MRSKAKPALAAALVVAFTFSATAALQVESPDQDYYRTGEINLNLTWNEPTSITDANYSMDGDNNESMEDQQDQFYNNISSESLEEGSHTVTFWAENESGITITESVDFTVDSSPPVFDKVRPENSSWVNGTVELYVEMDEQNLDYVEYNISGNDNSPGNLSEDLVATEKLENGTYEVNFTAVDLAGNANSAVSNFSVDTVPPVLEILERPSGAVEGDITVEAAASDNISEPFSGLNQTFYRIDGEKSSFNESLDLENASEGQNEVEVVATDEASNRNVSAFNVTVDNEAPDIDSVEVNGIEMDEGRVLPEQNTVEVDAEDEGTSVEVYRYLWDDGTGEEFQETNESVFNRNLSSGSYNFSIRVSDETGNWNNQTYATGFQVDVETPEMDYEFLNSTDGWIKDSVDVQINCTDSTETEVSVLRSMINYRDWRDSSSEVFTLEADGEKTFEFRCRDNAGNNVSEEEVLKIDPQKPEIDSTSPYDGKIGLRTRFDVTVELDKTGYSGIDTESSSFHLHGEGEILETEWKEDENLFTVSLDHLEEYTSYDLGIRIRDNAGHRVGENISFRTGESLYRENYSLEKSLDTGIAEFEVENIAESGNLSLEMGGSRAIQSVELRASERFENTTVSVKELNSVPSGVEEYEEELYTFATVEDNGGFTENSKISFSVKRSWMNETDLEYSEIALATWNGTWNVKEAELEETNDERMVFSADLEGSESFAVVSSREEAGLVESLRQRAMERRELLKKAGAGLLALFILLYVWHKRGSIRRAKNHRVEELRALVSSEEEEEESGKYVCEETGKEFETEEGLELHRELRGMEE